LGQFVDELRGHIASLIEAKNAFLVEIALRGEGNSRILEVFVDTDSGITIDACAELNKEITATLSRENLIHGLQRVDVSSPGLDRPLRLYRQYRKNIGRDINVTFCEEDGQERTVTGELVEAKDDGITVKLNDRQLREIRFIAIDKAFVQVRF
jgi:ribosome maturation factor RimP